MKRLRWLKAENAELRRENERLHKNIDINLELLEKAEAALAAERAQRERMEKAGERLIAWTQAGKSRGATGHDWADQSDRDRDIAAFREALRPAAPGPTPSVKRCDCPVPDCQHHRGLILYPAAGSEQPDLPLGHEFVAGHPHPAYQSYCALRGIFGLCGQPESVHRRKP